MLLTNYIRDFKRASNTQVLEGLSKNNWFVSADIHINARILGPSRIMHCNGKEKFLIFEIYTVKGNSVVTTQRSEMGKRSFV